MSALSTPIPALTPKPVLQLAPVNLNNQRVDLRKAQIHLVHSWFRRGLHLWVWTILRTQMLLIINLLFVLIVGNYSITSNSFKYICEPTQVKNLTTAYTVRKLLLKKEIKILTKRNFMNKNIWLHSIMSSCRHNILWILVIKMQTKIHNS